MNGTLLLAIVFIIVYVPLIGYVYGRQGRWLGAAGWVLLMGGVLLAIGGGGALFPWAGLLWTVIAAFGALMLIMEWAERRRT